MLGSRGRGLVTGLCLAASFVTAPAFARDVELIVSAAASLTNAFTELGKAYERDHPDVAIVFNFGGSGQLLQQIDRGAPVDVFASADEETMDQAQRRNLIIDETRVDFAGNTLVMVGPSDSSLAVSSIEDLRAKAIRRIAVSNPDSVPVGRYAKAALEMAGLWDVLEPKFINTQHVRQSLDYVARGEVDVGFVYATDAAAMQARIRVLAQVPVQMPIRYPVAVVSDSRSPERAREFVAFVKSPTGQSLLRRHGFTPLAH